MIEVIWHNRVKVELDVIEEFEAFESPLYRFTVLELKQPSPRAVCTEYPYWEPIEDASYCTMISEDTPYDKLTELAAIIMRRVYDKAASGLSIKKECEELSWMNEDWTLKGE